MDNSLVEYLVSRARLAGTQSSYCMESVNKAQYIGEWHAERDRGGGHHMRAEYHGPPWSAQYTKEDGGLLLSIEAEENEDYSICESLIGWNCTVASTAGDSVYFQGFFPEYPLLYGHNIRWNDRPWGDSLFIPARDGTETQGKEGISPFQLQEVKAGLLCHIWTRVA